MGICQCAMSCASAFSTGVISRGCPKICRKSMIFGTLPGQIEREMVLIMQNIPEHGQDAKNGLKIFRRLEALILLPLPICWRNGCAVDVEHASDYEFTSWLRWNGVPFTGLTTWTFDNRCAVINYALEYGVKLRLVTIPPERCLGTVSELFIWPLPTPEVAGGKPPDGVA